MSVLYKFHKIKQLLPVKYLHSKVIDDKQMLTEIKSAVKSEIRVQ